MATLTCPNCAAQVEPDDLICFTCGANLPRSAAYGLFGPYLLDEDASVRRLVDDTLLRLGRQQRYQVQ